MVNHLELLAHLNSRWAWGNGFNGYCRFVLGLLFQSKSRPSIVIDLLRFGLRVDEMKGVLRMAPLDTFFFGIEVVGIDILYQYFHFSAFVLVIL